MAAPECWVAGCESSAHTVSDLTRDQPNQGWARLPGEAFVCNLHAAELGDPDTEWMLDRDGRPTLYVGSSLRKLNEYILLGVEEIAGYGTDREFSHEAEDGHHIRIRARRRGDQESELTLVVPSEEAARDLKDWVGHLPTD